MAPKRKNEVFEETARERKKQKKDVARTIAVQSVPSITASENVVAGPSLSAATTTSMTKRYPASIDVEKFAEARAFEIDAMQTAIKTAAASSTHRAWQVLPRHLRRRAASHDVRRVPLRLRDRARAEMDPVRRKLLGRSMPKRGKEKRISRTESFLRRQRDKLWLETHIWHAKRMKMENKWGYRLAQHPTEKSFRPSHRASIHGSIIHDASYYSLIELKGLEKILRLILELCCDPQGQGPGAKRYLTGARTFETHIYKPGSYPFNLIAPATIIWKPISPLADSSPVTEPLKAKSPTTTLETSNPASEPSNNSKSRKRKNKGMERETGASPSLGPLVDMLRTVWIRSHPAVFEDVFSALQTAASLTLDAVKRAPVDTQDNDAEVELADLSGQINVFEIMGPKSNQVIKGALTPVTEEKRDEFKKFWSALTDLQTSGSVPRGMIIGFKVNDPRLKFPPKNANAKAPGSGNVSSAMMTFPSSTLAQSELWDETTRAGLKKPRYKKKDLDERRSKNLIPGTHLSPLRQDDRVPVLLIQRSLEMVNSQSSSDSQSLHGWTLIIPSGWSMAFFSSLIFTGTRVGGQRERQTQSFEAGMAYFPRDYPSTMAYEVDADAREKEERERWERKPPAKRSNFEKLGTRSPWRADWTVVLGLEEERPVEGRSTGEFVTTQREDVIEEIPMAQTVRPWLLRGVNVPNIFSNLSKLFNHGAGLLSEVNKLRLKRNQDPLAPNIKADELWKAALVSVQVRMCTRGAPDDLAVIYSIGDEEARKWIRVLQKRGCGTASSDEESIDEVELSDIKPAKDSIIGYITTGNFSLSRGEGFAIGAIPVAQLFELQRQALRLHANSTNSKPSSILVKVRDRDGHKCRPAHVEVLDGQTP